MTVEIAIRRLEHGRELPLPGYETDGAAGMDLRAAVPADAPLTLRPGERGAAPTGLALAIPAGFEGQIRPRSGLALRSGLGLLNAPGTIDSDYRGEVMVILVNHGEEAVTIRRGDRIAQLVIAPVIQVCWREAERLEETARSAGGFGSTGIG